MKTNPIFMSSDDMVRALLNGRKTQTRRIMLPRPIQESFFLGGMDQVCWTWKDTAGPDGWLMRKMCPLGKPGDLLWVRESYFGNHYLHPHEPDNQRELFYRADGLPNFEGEEQEICWRHPIYMPRWASRLTLKITDVRVERLQEISEEDSISEGIIPMEHHAGRFTTGPGIGDGWSYPSAKNAYQALWQSIYGDDSWGENPWVWVIEFDVIQSNVDDVLGGAK